MNILSKNKVEMVWYGEDTNLSEKQIQLSDCILLDENRVLIVTLDGYNHQMLGIICTIVNTEITIENTINITPNISNLQYNKKPSVVKILNNKVIIFFITNNYYYSLILTINENEITVDKTPKLLSYSSEVDYIKAFTLTDNRIILFYSNGANRLTARIATINEDMSLTLGTETVSNVTSYEYSTSFCKISDDTIMIIYMSSLKLHGIICKINNLTTVFGLDTLLDNQDYSYIGNSITKISDNKVIVAHAKNNNYYMSLTYCSIEDTIISVISSKYTDNIKLNAYNETNNTDYFTSIVALTENSGIVAFRGSNGYPERGELYYVSFTIEADNDISFGNQQQLSTVAGTGQNAECLLLDISRILITHTILSSSDTSRKLFGIVYDTKVEKLAQKVKNKQSTIVGIAKTSAKDGQLVKVVTPIYEEEEN